MPQSHTATAEWQSFELRMRRRRVQRCVLRASAALEAGALDQAREAIEEAARLDSDDTAIKELAGAIAAAEMAPSSATAATAIRPAGVPRNIAASPGVVAPPTVGAPPRIPDSPQFGRWTKVAAPPKTEVPSIAATPPRVVAPPKVAAPPKVVAPRKVAASPKLDAPPRVDAIRLTLDTGTLRKIDNSRVDAGSVEIAREIDAPALDVLGDVSFRPPNPNLEQPGSLSGRWFAAAATLVLAAGFGGWLWTSASIDYTSKNVEPAAPAAAPGPAELSTAVPTPPPDEPPQASTTPDATMSEEEPATDSDASLPAPDNGAVGADTPRPDVPGAPLASTTGTTRDAPAGAVTGSAAASSPAPATPAARTMPPSAGAQQTALNTGEARTAASTATPVADEPIVPPARPVPDIPVAAAPDLPDVLPSSPPPGVPAPAANTSAPTRSAVETEAAAASTRSATDERLIRGALGRYEAAYNRLDARAAGAVWPSVDQRALGRAFDGLASQTISLGRCEVQLKGGIADARCSGNARWTPKVGGGAQTAARTWRFALKNTGADWVITSAEVR